jgi:hypothetical protein
MQSFTAIIEAAVVAVATILADRWLSTKWAVVVLCVGLLFLSYAHWKELEPAYEYCRNWSIENRAPAIIGFCLLGASVGLAIGYWAPSGKIKKNTEPPYTAKDTEIPPTMLDLFLGDFPTTLRVSDDDDSISIKFKDGAVTKIKRRVYMDFDAKSRFVGFYVRASVPRERDLTGAHTKDACVELVQHDAIQAALDHFQQNAAVIAGQSGQMTNMKDLTFSGRVFLYHDDFLSITQQAEIIKVYEQKHLAVNFRGPDYLGQKIIAWHQQHPEAAIPPTKPEANNPLSGANYKPVPPALVISVVSPDDLYYFGWVPARDITPRVYLARKDDTPQFQLQNLSGHPITNIKIDWHIPGDPVQKVFLSSVHTQPYRPTVQGDMLAFESGPSFLAADDEQTLIPDAEDAPVRVKIPSLLWNSFLLKFIDIGERIDPRSERARGLTARYTIPVAILRVAYTQDGRTYKKGFEIQAKVSSTPNTAFDPGSPVQSVPFENWQHDLRATIYFSCQEQ